MWGMLMVLGLVSTLSENAQAVMNLRAHAEHRGYRPAEVMGPWPYPFVSLFEVHPYEALDDVHVTIGLIVKKQSGREMFRNNKCEVLMRDTSLLQTHMVPFYGEQGLELWFTHLQQEPSGLVMLAIQWRFDPQMALARVEVTSRQGTAQNAWRSLPYHFRENPLFPGPEGYQEVTLDEVCSEIMVSGVEKDDS
ncbi:MAG: hypothetical protein R3B83_10625 [Nitrospirales bacterium]|nr:hypothetical protein [Nitrospira sp.]MDR4487961.1 hypothetical protein [Nitrospirales bacterium]